MSNVTKANAKLPNPSVTLQAGINPKTKTPVKFDLSNPANLKNSIKTQLRILDEQNAVNRGVWYNLPCNLTSQELERMLYYKGQLCFFYSRSLKEFYFLPFTMTSENGTGLDIYGRISTVKPIPFVGGATEDGKEEKKDPTPVEIYLSNLKLKVQYSPLSEVKLEDLTDSAVLLFDYTPQFNSKNVIPRFVLQDGVIDAMSDCIPFMRTALMLSTGITGMRVADGDQSIQAVNTSDTLYMAALSGKPYIPLESQLELQELVGKAPGKSEEFMLAMQSLDNYRLSLYGIDNGGLFEKKAHELQSEADINGGPIGLIQQDAISIRQNFCNIVNSIWDLGIWYEPSETLSKADVNGDGVLYDRNENGESSGVETPSEGGSENV